MARHTPCPRCGGQLIGWNDSDTSCLQCGHIIHPRSPWAADLLRHGVDLEGKGIPKPPEEANSRTPK